MSKVRINDLAKELEVKSRAILDVLPEIGVGGGKTHSSSLEPDEADKIRSHFQGGARAASSSSGALSRGQQTITPKIDLSHISKPGDVMKAILAKKKVEEEEARHPYIPSRPATPHAQPSKPTVTTAPPAAHAAPPAAPQAPVPPRRI